MAYFVLGTYRTSKTEEARSQTERSRADEEIEVDSRCSKAAG